MTGYGIAQNLRRHYSPWLLRGVVFLLLVANVINLGADLGAMGAALGLLIGRPEHLYTVLFGVVCILLETFMSYARYAAVLKWATLSLFAKRLERGRFVWPQSDGVAHLTAAQLAMLLEGIDWRHPARTFRPELAG